MHESLYAIVLSSLFLSLDTRVRMYIYIYAHTRNARTHAHVTLESRSGVSSHPQSPRTRNRRFSREKRISGLAFFFLSLSLLLSFFRSHSSVRRSLSTAKYETNRETRR